MKFPDLFKCHVCQPFTPIGMDGWERCLSVQIWNFLSIPKNYFFFELTPTHSNQYPLPTHPGWGLTQPSIPLWVG